MPITYVSGDPMLTGAQVLAFSHNAKGRTELGDLHTRLMRSHPAAFSMYQRHTRKKSTQAGAYWLWRETKPALMFMIVRDSAVGATRLRYVQAAMIELARSYRLEGIQSVAITPLGQSHEWDEIKLILNQWLAPAKLQVVVYDAVQPGVKADEGGSTG